MAIKKIKKSLASRTLQKTLGQVKAIDLGMICWEFQKTSNLEYSFHRTSDWKSTRQALKPNGINANLLN